MKKQLIAFALVSCSILPAIASGSCPGKKDQEAWRKDLQQHKANYISKELNLTEEQREKFLPLYLEMDNQLDELARSAREAERAVAKKDGAATDADYDKATEAMFQLKSKESKVEMQYLGRFSKILTKRQLFLLKDSERKFMRKVFDQHRRGAGKGNQGRKGSSKQ